MSSEDKNGDLDSENNPSVWLRNGGKVAYPAPSPPANALVVGFVVSFTISRMPL